MPARIVHRRDAVRPDESFLQFSVYRSAQDGQVCGYQIYNRRDGGDGERFVTTPFGVPVEKAWQPACAFVREHGIEVVWVNDPERLFQVPQDEARGGAASPAPAAKAG